MRNEPLTGYLLHHKPYQESRALYYFFTPTHGVVHGVGKKGIPLFAHIQLFATGKRSLKTFTQFQPLSTQPMLTGQNLYAGFYLNEILWRLLKHEDEMPKLWSCYQHTLNTLQLELTQNQLRVLLRLFENALFDELGYGFNMYEDIQGHMIQNTLSYRFVTDEGFYPLYEESVTESDNTFTAVGVFIGSSLLSIADYVVSNIESETESLLELSKLSNKSLQDWTRLHKLMIDFLLEYQPLKSRELWRQSQRYR